MISKKFGTRKKFIYAVMGLGILFICYLSILLGKEIIAHRWWYLSQILLSIPLSVSFLILISQIRMEKIRPVIFGGLIIGLSFLMIMSPDANIDNQLFSPNTGVRNGLIESELSGYKLIVSVSNHSIVTDELPAQNLRNMDFNISALKLSFLEENFSSYQDNTIIIREEIINNPFKFYNINLNLNFNPNLILEKNFSKVFNSNTLNGYIKSK